MTVLDAVFSAWLFARQLLLSDTTIGTILILVVANFALAVLAAVRLGNFDWHALANVFWRDVLPKVGGYLILRFLLAAIPNQDLVSGVFFGLVATGAYGVIVSELVTRIWGQLKLLGLVQNAGNP